MKSGKILPLLLAALVLVKATQDDSLEQPSQVIDITSSYFDEQVVNPTTQKLVKGPWFIKFYAPWCGHCKRLAPIWDEFAERNQHRLNVGRVDCSESDNSGLCSTYDIQGYPSLLLIKDGQFYKYSGERNVQGLEKFAFEKGYLQAKTYDEIPRKLEGFDLYKKSFDSFLKQLAFSINILFEKVGLGDIPSSIQLSLAGSLFFIPIMMMCYVILFMKDDIVDPEDFKREPATKKPTSQNRREKLE